MLAFASIKSHEANFSLSSALTRQSYKGEEKRKKEKKKRKKQKEKKNKRKKKRKKEEEKKETKLSLTSVYTEWAPSLSQNE